MANEKDYMDGLSPKHEEAWGLVDFRSRADDLRMIKAARPRGMVGANFDRRNFTWANFMDGRRLRWLRNRGLIMGDLANLRLTRAGEKALRQYDKGQTVTVTVYEDTKG